MIDYYKKYIKYKKKYIDLVGSGCDINELKQRVKYVCDRLDESNAVYYGLFVDNPIHLEQQIISMLHENNIFPNINYTSHFTHITFGYILPNRQKLKRLIESKETSNFIEGIQMLEKYENNLKLLEEFKNMKDNKLDVVITHIKITTNNMDKDNVLVLRVEPTEESKEIFEKFSQNENPHITGLCFKKSNGKMTAPVYSNEALKDSVPGRNIKVKIPLKLTCDLFPN